LTPVISTAFGTSTTIGVGADKLLSVNGSGVIVASSTIGNGQLQYNTISGIALGGTLANLSATDSTLTFSGTYTGATARTIGLNLGNGNTWTAKQTFTYASTTQLTLGGQLYDVNNSNGTAGYILMSQGGTLAPQWVATSSINNGVSSLAATYPLLTTGSTGAITISTALATTTIQQTYGAAQIGQITLATSTAASFNGLTISNSITNAGGTFTFAPPAITGTLTVSGGGTGQTSFTSGRLLYGSGTGALQTVATTTATLGLGLAYSGSSLGYLVGGGSGNLTIATSSLYTGSTNQLAYFSSANAMGGLANTTNGYVLSLASGAPAWVATSSINNGVSS
ncbi:MAG: hypothetical protein AAB592_03860, partial [Patescibacteria group bacterium]